MRARISRNRPHSWKGVVGGLVGGIAASMVMTQFQNGWSKVARRVSDSNPKPSSGESPTNERQEEEREDATTKAASKVAGLAGHALSREEKQKAGLVVHYGFGMLMGGLYGVGMELAQRHLPRSSPVIPGALFGTGLFLAADEWAVPALGLSAKPSESPIGTHLYGLASHLVYGLTLEGVRSMVRAQL